MRWIYRTIFWGIVYFALSLVFTQDPVAPMGLCAGAYYSNRFLMRTILAQRKYWLYGLSFFGLWAATFGGLEQAVQGGLDIPDWVRSAPEGKVVAGLLFISLPGFILAVSFQATLTKDWFEGFSIRDNYKFNLKKMKFERDAIEFKLVQAQLNPHLLKNILTVIYEMVLTKKAEAADSIVSLKEILDYLLYESSPEKKVALVKEVEFTKGILGLRSMGLDNPQKISINFPDVRELEKFQIPPLLLVPFIENLFSHCNLNESEGKAKINLTVDHSGNLEFSVRNTIGVSLNKSGAGGIGLSSLRKRLDVFYPNGYSLITGRDGGYFDSNLKIKLIA